MNEEEYDKIKGMKYDEYCEYLKNKYGAAKYPYMTKKGSPNQKHSRTKEGLFCHHIREDRVSLLTGRDSYKTSPYEYQLPENLCYCDYLEHMLLHILISEQEAAITKRCMHPDDVLGIRGIVYCFCPELNAFYSGYLPDPEGMYRWQISCFNRVKDDRRVYLRLCKRVVRNLYGKYPYAEYGCLCHESSKLCYIGWDFTKERGIHEDIERIERKKDDLPQR